MIRVKISWHSYRRYSYFNDANFVVALGDFGRLLSTWRTADLTVDWSVHGSSFLLCLHSAKHRSASSTRCCLWPKVSKRGIHFEYNFFMDNYLCKVYYLTLPSDIFWVSSISYNLIFRRKTEVFEANADCEPYFIAVKTHA